MEEENNENLKKNSLPLILEKLIKLDQKSTSQTLFTKAHRRRLLIREQALSSTFSWTPHQIEHSLYAYWSHMNQYYFKEIKEDDLERVDLMIEGSQPPLEKATVQKYTDAESYEAFKAIIKSSYRHLYSDPVLSEQNYKNLQKKYYISTKRLAQSSRKMKPSTNPPVFNYDVSSIKSAKSRNKIKGFLQEENRQLENFLKKNENNKNEKKTDDIEEEIKKLHEQCKKVSYKNIRNLNDLKHKASRKEDVFDITEIIDSSRTRAAVGQDKSSSLRKRREKKLTDFSNNIFEIRNIFVEYLTEVIIRLENHQAAESIKYVIDCKRPQAAGDKFKFCIIFDESLRTSESWIDEPTLDKLDKMREQSLFKVYKLPQKVYYSINSSNFPGFQYCYQKRENPNLPFKEKPWKDLIKRGFVEGTRGFTKEELFLKSKEFGLCHHCKYLYPEEFLLKCTFRSTDLKMPQMSAEYANPLAYHGNIPKRSMWNNKRTVSSFYQKKNGEFACMRMFCRLCLKQNFDQEVNEEARKPNWICPFCTGICNCTRCLRYDHLNKLMSLYSILGGDLETIKQESCLEKYVYGPESEDSGERSLNRVSYNALKRTRGAKPTKETKDVKGKLNLFKGTLKQYKALKDLRIKLERMRLLCSQVSKRERMKIKLDALKSKILEEFVEETKDRIDGKRRKPEQSLKDAEPPLRKKIKTSMPKKQEVEWESSEESGTPGTSKGGRTKRSGVAKGERDREEAEIRIEKKGQSKQEERKKGKNYIRKTSRKGKEEDEEDEEQLRKMRLRIPRRNSSSEGSEEDSSKQEDGNSMEEGSDEMREEEEKTGKRSDPSKQKRARNNRDGSSDEEVAETDPLKLLPRELQGILSYQNSSQFEVFNRTLDKRRVTRSSLAAIRKSGYRGKSKKKGS